MGARAGIGVLHWRQSRYHLLNHATHTMKLHYHLALARTSLLLALLLLPGCQKEDETQGTHVDVTIAVEAPSVLASPQLLQLKGNLGDVALRAEGATLHATVKPGTYHLDIEAEYQEMGKTSHVAASYSGDLVVEETQHHTTKVSLVYEPPVGKDQFLITEIFFAGVLTPEKFQYLDDRYIHITNASTDKTLYLDGIVLVRTFFQSNLIYDATPMPDFEHFVYYDVAYQFPGNGHDYPVKPGETIMICQSAIDHREACPDAPDLRGALFEWIDVKDCAAHDCPNNPTVPDMRPIYVADNDGASPDTYWVMNNNGGHGYALIRPEWTSPEEFHNDPNNQYYKWTFKVVVDGHLYYPAVPGEPCMKLPNEWVEDMVVTGIRDDFEWSPCSKLLDASYASIAHTHNTDLRYYLSVQRKRTAKGGWADTNNSQQDFEGKKATRVNGEPLTKELTTE